MAGLAWVCFAFGHVQIVEHSITIVLVNDDDVRLSRQARVRYMTGRIANVMGLGTPCIIGLHISTMGSLHSKVDDTTDRQKAIG